MNYRHLLQKYRDRFLYRKIEYNDNIRRSITFWSNKRGEDRIGIFVKGSCDLNTVFIAVPDIQNVINGYCCILKEGEVSCGRSDFILQCLKKDPPDSLLHDLEKRFNLSKEMFKTGILEKNILNKVNGRDMMFSKKVVLLSIMSDVVRDMYEHKETGFILDPGLWWLNNPMDTVLSKMEVAEWFRSNLKKRGKIDIQTFQNNYYALIKSIKEETGAHVIVFCGLTVDPGDRAYCYQFIESSPMLRNREFNLALVELSRQLDFSIIDVDRILKKIGINKQIEILHWPQECNIAIAQEIFRIMKEVGILRTF